MIDKKKYWILQSLLMATDDPISNPRNEEDLITLAMQYSKSVKHKASRSEYKAVMHSNVLTELLSISGKEIDYVNA